MKRVLEIYNSVVNSTYFKQTISPDCFLVHIFTMLPGDYNPDKNSLEDQEIHFGFYNASTHKVDTVICNKSSVKIVSAEELMHKDPLQAIDVDDIKISFKELYEIIGKLIKEKYKGNIPTKTIAVLQHKDGKTVWNMTVLRSDFKTLNIVIDAETGVVIDDSLKALFDFGS
jgi:uncharacterized membrane protein YkoI